MIPNLKDPGLDLWALAFIIVINHCSLDISKRASRSGVTGIHSVSVLYIFFAYPLARCKHFLSYVLGVETGFSLGLGGLVTSWSYSISHRDGTHDGLISLLDLKFSEQVG
jgi:hypothetical protein